MESHTMPGTQDKKELQAGPKRRQGRHTHSRPILSALSHRLIFLYTASTGLILAAALCLAWIYNAGQQQLHSRESFLQLFSNAEAELRRSSHLSHSWLGSLEREYHCNIYIEDNGHPISYRNIYQLHTPLQQLLGDLQGQAEELGIFTGSYPLTSGARNSGLLSLRGSGQDSYLAAVCQITDGATWRNLYLIQETTRPVQEQFFSASFFLLLFFAGLAVLFLISLLLIRRTLSPVHEALQKQKEFIASASHELRSPLAILRMNLDILKSAADHAWLFTHTPAPDNPEHIARIPSDDLMDCLVDMEAELSRMTALTDDMLLLASLDASGPASWRTQLIPLELDAFLIDLYEDFQSPAQQHGMELSLLLPDGPLPACLADPQRLRQIFTILFDNAFCYAKEGRLLTLSAASTSSSVQISLADHGPGIPAGKRSSVFERFSRGDASRTEKKHYGLGLSIAAELAALHHGCLSLTETPGGGCTFTLQLTSLFSP